MQWISDRNKARRPQLAALFALLALFFVLPAAPAHAITNGQPDGDAHPYVGVIFSVDWLCSGTLLSPTVVLTDAHCTVLFDSTTYVSFEEEPVPNPDLSQPWFFTDNAVAVAEVFTMPGHESVFPQLTGFDRNDIGVVILSEPVQSETFGVLPEAGSALEFTKGQAFTAVGYGVQSFVSGNGGRVPGPDSSRFMAPEHLIGVPAPSSQVGDEFLHMTGNPGGGKGGTCFGDSGGPVFLGDTNVIVGLNAFVTNWNCAGQNYATRVDTAEALEFINQFL